VVSCRLFTFLLAPSIVRTFLTKGFCFCLWFFWTTAFWFPREPGLAFVTFDTFFLPLTPWVPPALHLSGFRLGSLVFRCAWMLFFSQAEGFVAGIFLFLYTVVFFFADFPCEETPHTGPFSGPCFLHTMLIVFSRPLTSIFLFCLLFGWPAGGALVFCFRMPGFFSVGDHGLVFPPPVPFSFFVSQQKQWGLYLSNRRLPAQPPTLHRFLHSSTGLTMFFSGLILSPFSFSLNFVGPQI